MKYRYLIPQIRNDLSDKMVFIGGPRQVGKTTLAEYIAKEYFKSYQYLNWDFKEDRRKIINSKFDPESEVLIFDEIHKYKKWKNLIKGEYDKNKQNFKYLVTGSARLDVYIKGGDSLFGRYHYFRLHPFTIPELMGIKNNINVFHRIHFPESTKQTKEFFSDLMRFGGFPEPLFKQNEKTLRRWHNERIDRLVREDIRNLQNLKDLSSMQLLIDALPDKVGSLFSINSLREDLEYAHRTVANWLDILEKFYYQFRIYPFLGKKIRSLKKESKLYLWDWSEIVNDAVKLENIVASHLLKLCHYLRDAEGYKTDLYFLRDQDGREVDFLVTCDSKPWFAVEVKSSSAKVAGNLKYFAKKIDIPFLYQVVLENNIDYLNDSIRVMSADKFLSALI